MTKHTYEADGKRVYQAEDLTELVSDKRSVWRATRAKARRRQRRYMNRLTRGAGVCSDIFSEQRD